MSPLRSEPAKPLRTLDEFFAIAQRLEQEAAARYAQLATRMRALDLPEVAAVFEHLAAEERGHADRVEDWSRSETGAPPDSARLRWQPPEAFDEEAARAMASSSLASAYRALSMAVRNEERAFALWTYIAAEAEDPAIQVAAERMAGEELRHAALLRRERRRAFHAGRQAPAADAAPAPPRLPPAAEAARSERALAALLAALAEDAAPGQAPELRRLAAEAAGMAGEAAAFHADAETPGGGEPPDGLPEALRLAERAVEAYLDAADGAQEEARLRQLQSLAERAIARIALLRQMADTG
jgi:rubrerythrin